MVRLSIQIFIILIFLYINSPARTTAEDCREHDNRCQGDCFEIYNNVKYKSDTTEEYLSKCRNICIRRKESCIKRARKLKLMEKSRKPIDVTSAIDEISQSAENYPRTPNKIYKFRDDKGQLHVVDDIKKSPKNTGHIFTKNSPVIPDTIMKFN